MAYEVHGDKLGQLVAAADLSGSQFFFVEVTAADTVNAPTAIGKPCIGVVQNKPTAGQPVELVTTGVTKVVASAAITAGAKVMNSANGRAALAATTGSIVLGIALQAAGAAGDIISVQLGTFGQV